METLVLPLSIASLVISIVLTIVFTSRGRHDQDNNLKLPPGNFGWPVIGETVRFLFGKPEKFVVQRMEKYSSDIFKTIIFGEKTAVICGPNGHKFIFSNDQTLFAPFRPHPMQRLFKSYQTKARTEPGPPTDEAKAIKQPGFLKPEPLARFLGVMDSITLQLIQSYWQGQDFILAFPFAKTLTLTLACRFFLGNVQEHERITRLVNHFDNVTSGMHSIILNFPGTTFYRASKSADAIRKELKAVIDEKKAAIASGKRMEDILSHLIVVSDANGKNMPEAEIADKMMGLLVAGYSTVATTITFLIKYVGERPDIYNNIRKEQMEIASSKKPGELLEWEDIQKMKYSWNVVCETMRLTPPLQGTFREVLKEFTFAGYTVPKGWKVYWTMGTTNKNPEYFKEPEKFDPTRFEGGERHVPYTYVPFGVGPRMCPGKEYARLAILAFVHNVVKNYRWEVINPNEKIVGDMIPTPQNGLPIRLYHH